MAQYDANLIHTLFEAQVSRSPYETAVECETERLSYSDLNSRSNQLARYLQDLGVRGDQPVALLVDRSVDMFIVLMGILKAGGAYLPLDPDYPSDRLAYMLSDASPQVLLFHERFRERLPDISIRAVPLDSSWNKILSYDTTNIDTASSALRSDNLAYIIYTSGSTGRPKGVMVDHGSVVNLWSGLEHLYQRSRPCRRIALNASLCFDASVQQIVQLLSGRAIVVVPQKCRYDPFKLLDLLVDSHIDGIDCTPSQLKLWTSAGFLESGRHECRMVLVGGEAIDTPLWRSLSQCSGIDFFNVYGPTECTVDATFASLDHVNSMPHIGRPMAGRCIYVADEHGEQVPMGTPGEIFIAGSGVARGYFKQPKLTAQRFIADRHSKVPQRRLYRTGDVGRSRVDGTIEYLGRTDDQVKIRGFRIELGEIESQLAQCPSVAATAVIAHDDGSGEQQLVAYVSHRGNSCPDVEALRATLKATLPAYMVPSSFVFMESLPLLPNGKLDRHSLPSPTRIEPLQSEYQAPQGEVEQALARLWQEMLRVARVDRQAQFFELGGDSLAAMRLVVRVRETFGIPFHTHAVFRNPTLHRMAQFVENSLAGTSVTNRTVRD